MKPTTKFILLFILVILIAGGIQFIIDTNKSNNDTNDQPTTSSTNTGNIETQNNILNNNDIDISEVKKMSNTVIFETTKGKFTVELNEDDAPITVANFKKYVADGYYDGTIFHRVIPEFMIQGGGFLPDGKEKDTRRPITLEVNTGLTNMKGTLAMARTNDPNSATSQFFINVKDNAFLNAGPTSEGYAVFGKVTDGMDTILGIEKVNTTRKAGHDDWPVEDVIVTKAYFKE